ncbi:hypothetical protein [Burkholderia sp. Ax-1719]|nr:hypothetical protein [Burkholderia sp. Ax-1719]
MQLLKIWALMILAIVAFAALVGAFCEASEELQRCTIARCV